MIIDGQLRSRSLKPFPNIYIHNLFSDPSLNGLDGEFVLGNPTAPDVYRVTNSALARIEGEPKITLYVFDDFVTKPDAPFLARLAFAEDRIRDIRPEGNIVLLPHAHILSLPQLDEYEELHTGLGYEGVMLRDPNGLYKFGRSTTNEGGLLKLKRYEDMDAAVVGIEEEMHNGNVAQVSELGRTKRSTHKAGKTGKGTMGALVCHGLAGPFEGVEFKVGSGFTAEDRARDDWVDKIIKIKYFAVGVKDRPRHPVYLGERMKEDM